MKSIKKHYLSFALIMGILNVFNFTTPLAFAQTNAQDNANKQLDIETLRAKANEGDALAQNDLGLLYISAQGVVQDYAKAEEYLKKLQIKATHLHKAILV